MMRRTTDRRRPPAARRDRHHRDRIPFRGVRAGCSRSGRRRGRGREDFTCSRIDAYRATQVRPRGGRHAPQRHGCGRPRSQHPGLRRAADAVRGRLAGRVRALGRAARHRPERRHSRVGRVGLGRLASVRPGVVRRSCRRGVPPARTGDPRRGIRGQPLLRVGGPAHLPSTGFLARGGHRLRRAPRRRLADPQPPRRRGVSRDARRTRLVDRTSPPSALAAPRPGRRTRVPPAAPRLPALRGAARQPARGRRPAGRRARHRVVEAARLRRRRDRDRRARVAGPAAPGAHGRRTAREPRTLELDTDELHDPRSLDAG